MLVRVRRILGANGRGFTVPEGFVARTGGRLSTLAREMALALCCSGPCNVKYCRERKKLHRRAHPKSHPSSLPVHTQLLLLGTHLSLTALHICTRDTSQQEERACPGQSLEPGIATAESSACASASSV